MIKRILVALDPDEDTPVATRYAIRLAKRFNAGLTGMAVVDVGNIETMIGVGGYGTELHGRKIWAEMADKTRQVAEELLESFQQSVEKAGVRHRDVKKHGASADLIIEEMKYHDILIVGRDSRFFYNEPERDTGTLAKVVKGGNAPVMVVTDEFHDIEKVMIAFDGSAPAARSLKGFVHLLPFGKDVEIELVHVPKDNTDRETELADAILRQAELYLKEHNFNYINRTVLEKGNPGELILARQIINKPDLVILGAHSVSAIRRAAFGSTTDYIIKQSEGALFLSP
jgi:nucleotide-binding universal stress UspA family protein